MNSLSFISWVNDDATYQGLLDSLPPGSQAIKVGQEFNSLSKAYNHGTSLATGDILIYCHQDVIIRDTNFARIVSAALQSERAGFAGPIGNIAPSPYTWWDIPANNRGWLLQDIDGCDVMQYFGAYDGPASQLDGLMMCTRKRFTFPEELPGIHAVDLWMCALAESLGYQNRIFSACVKHLSWGEQDRSKLVTNYEAYLDRWRR